MIDGLTPLCLSTYSIFHDIWSKNLETNSIVIREKYGSVSTILPLVKLKPKMPATAVKVSIKLSHSADNVEICSKFEDVGTYKRGVRCGSSSSFGIRQRNKNTSSSGSRTYHDMIAFRQQFRENSMEFMSTTMNSTTTSRRRRDSYVIYLENHNLMLSAAIRWSVQINKANKADILELWYSGTAAKVFHGTSLSILVLILFTTFGGVLACCGSILSSIHCLCVECYLVVHALYAY